MKVLLMAAASTAVAGVGFGVWSMGQLLGRPGDLDKLAEALGLRPGSVVADIGAGSGGWAFRMAEKVGASGRVYATEIDENKLETLRRRVVELKSANVTVLRADRRTTGLPDQSCDAVYLRGVYHHLMDPRAFHADVARALRPGGRMAVVDFAPDGPWAWHFVFDRSPAGTRRHGHGVAAADVAREATGAGFRLVTQVEGWSGGYHLTLLER